MSMDYVFKVFDYLHSHPEVSGEEIVTSEYLAGELKKSGFKVKEQVNGSRGVIGVWDSGKKGKKIALRADMDALPYIEEGKRVAKHTCGHDAHCAMVLAAAKQIQNHEFSKQYLAVINGILPEKEGELCDYLAKDSNGNTRVVSPSNGKKSILKYKVIAEKDNYSLVEITLITGRHHQIRVQFSSRGYPLVGDQRYGNRDKKQIALCSYKLSFCHPITKEKLVFCRKPNENDIWNLFCEK